jgi:hypothetical protein
MEEQNQPKRSTDFWLGQLVSQNGTMIGRLDGIERRLDENRREADRVAGEHDRRIAALELDSAERRGEVRQMKRIGGVIGTIAGSGVVGFTDLVPRVASWLGHLVHWS